MKEWYEVDCDFVEFTDRGNYCCYKSDACNWEECEFYKNGVGKEDLKGALIGIDAGGNPIYS